MPQSQWPLANANSVDIFDPFTFGEDAQGRAVSLCLAETNMLIGALPGAGKTTSLRQVLLAAALDPRSEIWCWEFKGTGDFTAISRVAARYGSGPDDLTMRSALDGLRALRKECDRRAAVIRELDREHCPEFKVTTQVANTRGLHPLVVAIDEAQMPLSRQATRQRSRGAGRAYHQARSGTRHHLDHRHSATRPRLAAHWRRSQRRHASLPASHGPGGERHDLGHQLVPARNPSHAVHAP